MPLTIPYRELPLILLLGCSSGAAAPAPTSPTRPTSDAAAVAPEEAAPPAAPTASAEPAPEPLPNDGTLLSHSKIQTIVRGRFADIAGCYEDALARDPNIGGGLINVMLVIEGNGSVLTASAQTPPKPVKRPKWQRRPAQKSAPMLTDAGVRKCVEQAFRRIQFPPTNRGIMNMIYPVELSVE